MSRLLARLTGGRWRFVCGQLARTTPIHRLPAQLCGCTPHRRARGEL